MELYHIYLIIGVYELGLFVFLRDRKTFSSKYGKYKDSSYIMELQKYSQIITGSAMLLISILSYFYPRIGLYLVPTPVIIYEFLAYILRKSIYKKQ